MSTPDRVNELFDLAVDLPVAERKAFLEKACGGDASLLNEVQAMLDADNTAGAFLSDPTYNPRELAARVAGGEGPGSRIGHYRILELIGEGGFGSVFMAEQSHPVRRRVALKIIKLGMDTRQVVARFEAERQALAMMDHPNIARVLDAGATDTGRPYFVMELVRGKALTRYCDEHTLNLRERLELFMQVCHAVQHAHQKGIIHRDLKPSNVLVTMVDGKPTPKIIDFGIAKATQTRLTDRTLFTEFQQLIGTPAYMSPEQASPNAEDIDTRSDIYSLGVLMYELLTGTTPFDARTLAQAAHSEVQRIIREVDPPKPSTRVSSFRETLATVAAVRAVTPDELKSALRGELDWIVMRCIEKQRSRRYDTASALAADVLAYLENRPVSAAPPSIIYRTRKLLRRHGWAIGTAAMIVIALAAGLVISLAALRQTSLEQQRTQAALQEAERQRLQAQEATAAANEVNRFLNEMLASANPLVARGREVTVEMLLQRAADGIEGRFTSRPLMQAAVHDTIGQSYAALSKHKAAVEHLEAANKLREALGLGSAAEYLASRVLLAMEYHQVGQFAPSRELFQRSVAQARSLLEQSPTDIVPAVDGMREAYTYVGVSSQEISELFRMAYERREKLLGANHEDTVACFEAYAWTHAQHLSTKRRADEAEPLMRSALDRYRAALGADDARTLRTQCRMGRYLVAIDKDEEGFALYRDALRRFDEKYGQDYPPGIKALLDFADMLEDANRWAEALPLRLQALDRYKRVYGDDSAEVARSLSGLATAYERLGRVEEAIATQKQQFESTRRVYGPDDLHTLFAQYGTAKVLARYGHDAEAEPLLVDLKARWGKAVRADLPACLDSQNWLVRVWERLGKSEQAVALAREVYDRALANARPGDAKEVAMHLSVLGPLLVRMGEYQQAEVPLREAMARLESTGQTHGSAYPAVLAALAEALESTERAAEAKPIRQKVATLPATAPAGNPNIGAAATRPQQF